MARGGPKAGAPPPGPAAAAPRGRGLGRRGGGAWAETRRADRGPQASRGPQFYRGAEVVEAVGGSALKLANLSRGPVSSLVSVEAGRREEVALIAQDM